MVGLGARHGGHGLEGVDASHARLAGTHPAAVRKASPVDDLRRAAPQGIGIEQEQDIDVGPAGQAIQRAAERQGGAFPRPRIVEGVVQVPAQTRVVLPQGLDLAPDGRRRYGPGEQP